MGQNSCTLRFYRDSCINHNVISWSYCIAASLTLDCVVMRCKQSHDPLVVDCSGIVHSLKHPESAWKGWPQPAFRFFAPHTSRKIEFTLICQTQRWCVFFPCYCWSLFRLVRLELNTPTALVTWKLLYWSKSRSPSSLKSNELRGGRTLYNKAELFCWRGA